MFLLKSFATPVVWVLVPLLLGLALTTFRRRKKLAKAGWCSLLLGTLLLLLFSFPPFANILVYSLESRCPPPSPDVLATVDVIVVLGGGGYPSGGFREEAELARRAYPRLYYGVRIFQQGHAEILAFCGGEFREGKEREADVMRTMALQLGVPEDKIMTEMTSANTMQNAKRLAELLPARPGRQIGLVTSATHMVRSVRTFASQFRRDTIVPVPVHYQYDPDPWRFKNLRPSVVALERSTEAIHEWIGLRWYSLRYR